MPSPRQQSSNGVINRAGQRQAPAPRPAASAAPFSRAPVRPPPTAGAELLKTLLQILGVTAGLVALLVLVYLTRDSIAVGNHLAEARNERTTLVCQAGRMSHGDESLYDKVFEKGYFVCTDWRTLQAIELNEKPR